MAARAHVLFTTAPSLTPLIPNGFGLTRGSTSRGIMRSYFYSMCRWLVISCKWMCLCWVSLRKPLRVYHPGPRMKLRIKVCENVLVEINHFIVRLYQCGGVGGSQRVQAWSPMIPILTEQWLWGYFHCRRGRPSRRQEHDFVMFVMSEHWLTRSSLKRFPPCSSTRGCSGCILYCSVVHN